MDEEILLQPVESEGVLPLKDEEDDIDQYPVYTTYTKCSFLGTVYRKDFTAFMALFLVGLTVLMWSMFVYELPVAVETQGGNGVSIVKLCIYGLIGLLAPSHAFWIHKYYSLYRAIPCDTSDCHALRKSWAKQERMDDERRVWKRLVNSLPTWQDITNLQNKWKRISTLYHQMDEFQKSVKGTLKFSPSAPEVLN